MFPTIGAFIATTVLPYALLLSVFAGIGAGIFRGRKGDQ
jgi:hypothetical protein